MFSAFGLPRQLHSDQGWNFESQLVTELCNITGVYKTRTTAFHPHSDELTERANRTILAMLRAATYKDTKQWPSKLPSVLAACRMTVHSTTGVTPNRAMHGRKVLLPASLIVVTESLRSHYSASDAISLNYACGTVTRLDACKTSKEQQHGLEITEPHLILYRLNIHLSPQSWINDTSSSFINDRNILSHLNRYLMIDYSLLNSRTISLTIKIITTFLLKYHRL